MKTLHFEPYTAGQAHLPGQGQHVVAHSDADSVVVYQAFNPHIAQYAVAHQRFGGAAYSFNRMTWIKPNFMWMMYRAGWAQKPGQEHILAIWLSRSGFDEILTQAVHSSYQAEVYGSEENWKVALTNSEVRLQWDPDHDPLGHKLERRAIQLGLRGQVQRRFNEEWLLGVEDITPWVATQWQHVAARQLQLLETPVERVIDYRSRPDVVQRLQLD